MLNQALEGEIITAVGALVALLVWGGLNRFKNGRADRRAFWVAVVVVDDELFANQQRLKVALMRDPSEVPERLDYTAMVRHETALIANRKLNDETRVALREAYRHAFTRRPVQVRGPADDPVFGAGVMQDALTKVERARELMSRHFPRGLRPLQ